MASETAHAMERIKTPSYQKWFIGIGIAILLTLLLSPSLTLHLKEYKVGDIASKEIKSPQDLLVEDEKSTQEKRADAERSVLSIYDYDPAVLRESENRVRSTFESLAVSFQKKEKGVDQNALRKKEWDASLRLPLNQREWQILEKEHFNPAIGEAALKLIAPILKKGVVNDKDLLDPDAEKGFSFGIYRPVRREKVSPLSVFLTLRKPRPKSDPKPISLLLIEEKN
jgi:membrane-associated HD superfamily phosphohydrolase